MYDSCNRGENLVQIVDGGKLRKVLYGRSLCDTPCETLCNSSRTRGVDWGVHRPMSNHTSHQTGTRLDLARENSDSDDRTGTKFHDATRGFDVRKDWNRVYKP